MAHVAKFTRGAMGHMLSHYDRTKDGFGDNVDLERTRLNYNLAQADQPEKQLDFIHRRLKEVKLQNRKDVNVICDWVVTAPKDLAPAEHERFFQACYNFFADRYQRKNIVSAYVHMDETTPHMHFAFMPIVADRKHPEREKVSAKEVITRKDLQTLHPDLQKYVERELGHEVGILNEATRDGNKTVTELKRAEELKKQSALQEQTDKYRDELDRVKVDLRVKNRELFDLKFGDLVQIRDEFEKVSKDLRGGRKELSAVQKQIGICRKEMEMLQQKLQVGQEELYTLESDKNTVEMQLGAYGREMETLQKQIGTYGKEIETLQQKLQIGQQRLRTLESDKYDVQKQIGAYNDDLTMLRGIIKQTQTRRKELETENASLKAENDNLQQEMEKYVNEMVQIVRDTLKALREAVADYKTYRVPIDKIEGFGYVQKDAAYSDLLRYIQDNYGNIEPIMVIETEDNKYMLLDGQRRMAAYIEAGYMTIPCRKIGLDKDNISILQRAINEEHVANEMLKEDLTAAEEREPSQDIDENSGEYGDFRWYISDKSRDDDDDLSL